MLTAVAVIASLALIAWLIFRAVRQRPVKASTIIRALAYLTGLFTYAYFLSMSIPLLVQVVVSIVLGAILIIIAASIQRRRQTEKSE